MSEYIRRELEKMDLPEAGLDIIENLQSRAEAAEQERDKLKETINLAIGVLNMMQSGRFDKQTVIELLERIIEEGSKPDGE